MVLDKIRTVFYTVFDKKFVKIQGLKSIFETYVVCFL